MSTCFTRAKGATLEALCLIAAFCRLAESLSHSEQMGWLVGAVGIEHTTSWSVAAIDPLAALLQDGFTVKQMERSGLWLLTVRWSRTGLLKSPDQQPTVGMAIAKDTPFIASGRRQESDNYLFLNRADAESFKGRIEERVRQKVSPKWKVKADIVEVTPEDVAHLDLDPAARKVRKFKV